MNSPLMGLGIGLSAVSLATDAFEVFCRNLRADYVARQESESASFSYYLPEDVDEMLSKIRNLWFDYSLRLIETNKENKAAASKRISELESRILDLNSQVSSRERRLKEVGQVERHVGRFRKWLLEGWESELPKRQVIISDEKSIEGTCCVYAALEFFTSFHSDTYCLNVSASEVMQSPLDFSDEDIKVLGAALRSLAKKSAYLSLETTDDDPEDWTQVYKIIEWRGKEIYRSMTPALRKDLANPEPSDEVFNKTRRVLEGQANSLCFHQRVIGKLPESSRLRALLIDLESQPFADHGSRQADPMRRFHGQNICLFDEFGCGSEVTLSMREPRPTEGS